MLHGTSCSPLPIRPSRTSSFACPSTNATPKTPLHHRRRVLRVRPDASGLVETASDATTRNAAPQTHALTNTPIRRLPDSARVPLHLVSSKSTRQRDHFGNSSNHSYREKDFTRVIDPHAEAFRQLEENHNRRFRRTLFELQQRHPDLWWRMQCALHYEDHTPQFFGNDTEAIVFSRVTGEVRDGGVEWIPLRNM